MKGNSFDYQIRNSGHERKSTIAITALTTHNILMFTILGRAISRHPKIFIVFWLALIAVGATGSLWGFGQGNIFARMSSSESMLPGSDSDDVLLATGNTDEGESLIITVNGDLTANDLSAELATLQKALEDQGHLADFNDPASVRALFEEKTAKAVNDAVAQAVADNQAAIDGAVQQALALNADAINNAQMMGGEVAATQARDEVETAARNAAITEIETQARQAAEEAAASQENPAASFISDDGFVVVVNMEPGTSEDDILASETALHDFEAAVAQAQPGTSVDWVSNVYSQQVVLDQTAKDLIVGEAIGLPIALLLLIVVFGGVVAAGLPLGSALISIGIGLGGIWAISFFTNVDSFIINIVSLVGLSLSIDYGLLVVSRYREEIAQRLAARNLPSDGTLLPADTKGLVRDAVAETVATAGRTISFSALTIAFAIAGLFVMQAPILRMIAAGGVIVTVLAVATAVTLIPALAVLLGHRLVKPSKLSRMKGFRTLVKKVGDSSSDTGFFSRLAQWVHARPWKIMVVVFAALLVAALPIRDLTMRSNFIEYLPADSTESVAFEEIQTNYPDFATSSGTVLAYTDAESTAELSEFIADIPGVTSVREPVELAEAVKIDFFVDADDQVGPEVTRVVRDIRAFDTDYETKVGGSAALQLDFNESIAKDAPKAGTIIVISVFILLFLLTGSIIAPLKALLINAISLLAGLGLTVLIFEHGLFGMPMRDGLETMVVATAVCFGFGLAMDYEVFLLARIKEYWDKGLSNDEAVEMGLQRSGRIITSAAAIIIAVFIGFIFGDLIAIKQIGVALALIVFVDATIVRMLLVPATMTVLRQWNWWAPKPLRKIYEKFKIVH